MQTLFYTRVPSIYFFFQFFFLLSSLTSLPILRREFLGRTVVTVARNVVDPSARLVTLDGVALRIGGRGLPGLVAIGRGQRGRRNPLMLHGGIAGISLIRREMRFLRESVGRGEQHLSMCGWLPSLFFNILVQFFLVCSLSFMHFLFCSMFWSILFTFVS